MTGPSLASLQRLFQERILAGRPGVDAHVLSSVQATARERIQVYVDAFSLRLLDVLRKDFPGVRSLLGEHDFERLVRDYISAHVPDARSLRWAGRHLPAFLKRARRDRPVLAEMAEFEWQQSEVFDAPDAPIVGETEIAALPAAAWPDMRLKLQPSVRMLDLGWNVVEYSHALARKGPPPAPRLESPRKQWLLWRKSLTVHWRSLDEGEAAALAAVAKHATFAELCEQVAAWDREESAALRSASLLKRWTADGLISNLITGHGRTESVGQGLARGTGPEDTSARPCKERGLDG